MAEYIDRQAAIDAILRNKRIMTGLSDDVRSQARKIYAQAHDHVCDVINTIPSADVEPVRRGIWTEIHAYTFDLDSAMCSECKGISFFSKPTKYCPHCHAVMGNAYNGWCSHGEEAEE